MLLLRFHPKYSMICKPSLWGRHERIENAFLDGNIPPGVKVVRCRECQSPIAIDSPYMENLWPFCGNVCERRYRTRRGREQYRQAHPAKPANCGHCQASFTPLRSTARYCSTRCRVAAHRAKLTEAVTL